ncbi:COL6A6 [Branchiostoma lanceolatum]|uniref:COL6A6 protein n=1 Tax=Branchiostoma lanceolatum TaxID=7740 RepID=A0A8J9ZQ66_BRALA|nr:COL6A6 [Branchiostoma lanceolatum]
MVWKLLLPTLVMFVAIHGATGQFQGLPPQPPAPIPPVPQEESVPYPPAPEPEPQPPVKPGPGVCTVDVVFVIDESSSISTSWFNRVKRFIVDFLNCFKAFHQIWLGIIQFNCVSRTYLPLGPPYGLPPFIFDDMMQEGGLSRIGKAIRYMRDTTRFRDDYPRVAVVLTDGWDQSDSEGQATDDYAAQADAARAAGIELYAVGVGDPGQADSAALEAIGGSSGHVFSIDNPCKVAFRIMAEQCIQSGVPGCGAYKGDAIVPLGSSYELLAWRDGGVCGSCECSDDGHMECSGTGCPLQYPPCENNVQVAPWCCPACADADKYDVPDGCKHEDGIIPVGVEYKPDDCTTCTCPAAGAQPECISMACLPADCPNPVYFKGQCCPVCAGCLEGDVLIPVGCDYQPDPCTYCHCEAVGAAPICAVQDCARPPCANPVHVPGQCCPVCYEIGCEHAHGLILPGKPYQVDACERCYCPFPGEEPICSLPIRCMAPMCDTPVYIAGQCCAVCDAPDGCLYREENIIIPVMTDYRPDPCRIVTCFEPGGEPAIAIMDCPPPDMYCPNYVRVAGECCPVCLG